jgi:ADA HAT complex component 1
MESDLTNVQQAIEAQFNYEILLKHNELRLIEQELAKCQVSPEQLRRCSLVPFPGTEGFSQDASSGIGLALQPPSGYTEDGNDLGMEKTE